MAVTESVSTLSKTIVTRSGVSVSMVYWWYIRLSVFQKINLSLSIPVLFLRVITKPKAHAHYIIRSRGADDRLGSRTIMTTLFYTPEAR
ncbi:hypothetical protein GBAR_LOCUS23276, partial [Geodia barretti]